MRMTNLHKADPALKIYVAASHHHSTLETISDLAHPSNFTFHLVQRINFCSYENDNGSSGAKESGITVED